MAIGPAWQEHDLIFPSAFGTPHDPDNVSHWFSRICRRAGLGHRHLPELRHSGASLMLAQGTDLYVVTEVLGHSSVAITKRRVRASRRRPEARSCRSDVRGAAHAQWLRNGSQSSPPPGADAG
jgi:integrase